MSERLSVYALEIDNRTYNLDLVPVLELDAPDRDHDVHAFSASIISPGQDRCGFAVGWMIACGRPADDSIHVAAR